MNKRELLSSIAVKTGFNGLLGYVQRFGEQKLTILAYHRVMGVDSSSYPFDLSLVSATPKDFEWQLEHITKRFTPIQFEDVIKFIDRGDPLPKRPIILSFDDGFDDNYHTVFPIAKRYSIPFSVFLSTDYIGSDDTFWFEKLAYLFSRSQSNTLMATPEIEYTLTDSIEDRRRSYYDFVERIKYFPHIERIQLLECLFERYADVFEDISPDEKKLSQPLTWEHIREMASWGVELGAHGATHNILTTMNDAELNADIAKSKKTIEIELGCDVNLFSYPNGLAEDYGSVAQVALRVAGYKTAVSYVPGNLSIKDIKSERYMLKRVHVDNDVSRDVFSIMLNFPDRII